jgi:hypothetical protein
MATIGSGSRLHTQLLYCSDYRGRDVTAPALIRRRLSSANSSGLTNTPVPGLLIRWFRGRPGIAPRHGWARAASPRPANGWTVCLYVARQTSSKRLLETS